LSQAPPTRRAELWAGIKATLPLVVGAMPFGIIFGAIATTGGLSPAATAGMSAFVYAGSAQFIGAGLFASGTPTAIIILTTFVVNLRHMLYAASLGPYVKHLPQRWLIPLGFWLTDETYVVVIQRFERPDDSPFKHWFFLGSALAMYLPWQLWTLIGMVAGRSIPDPTGWGLDFAMVVTFIGMVVPMVRNRPVLAAVLVASVTSVLANGLPNKLGLMVAALLGVAAGLAAQTIWGTPETRHAIEPTEVAP
jgi:4-azaleucine resistance transporter AzlC